MNILLCLTPKSKVVHVLSDQTIRQTLEKMQNYRYSAIPIIAKEGHYIGTISEGDLLWFIKSHKLNFSKIEKMSILDVPRSKNMQPISANANMKDIIDLSTQQNFVPVVDDYDTFIGIITRKAIVNYMVEKMVVSEPLPKKPSEELIKKGARP
ncbi:MAG: CBS domain-containing protein [Acholeplasmataceae bacterium]|nr:CBS domain-containing protein [Acholeplasmataceae bacterium]